jgi:hypothetical protein
VTLIVSATYDDSYPVWYERLPSPKIRVSTAEGGHPSAAFINAYRFDRDRHRSFLFLQDSLEPMVEDVVAPFTEYAERKRVPVVGWAGFPLFFDDAEQQHQVESQYPYVPRPATGIFGPIFYAERKALERLDRLGRFPKRPNDRAEAQGTERAWAYAFACVGIQVGYLHPWSNEFVSSGDALPFRKVFMGRA